MLDGRVTRTGSGAAVRFDRLIASPIEKVWDALTLPGRIADWLAPAEVELRVGGEITFRFEDHSRANCKITRLDPPRLLEYLWQEKHMKGPSRVQWELASEGSACRLILTHSFESGEETLSDFASGWHWHLDAIPRAIDGVATPFDRATWKALDNAYRAHGMSFISASVRFERTLPGPIGRVWDHLTDTSKLTGWFGEDALIEPREGGAVRLGGGHIRGVVTQWRPPCKLAYTWNVFGAGEAESPYPESYLMIELEPRGEDVRLTLTHLPILERFEKQNAMGWHTFLDMLGAAIRGEQVEPRSAYMQRNAEIYGVDLSNLVR